MAADLKSALATPYRLRSILQRYDIAHRDLYSRIRYVEGSRKGETISPTTLSMLMSQQLWPKTIPAESIRATVEAVLRDHNVPEAEIAEAWSIDGKADDAQATSRKQAPSQPNANSELTGAHFHLPEKIMLSPAARQHFNLPCHPFIDDVKGPADVYVSKEQRYVRESMYYAAKHSGLLAVVGESGAGKSTLRRDLIERIRRDNERISLIQPKTIDKELLTATHICDAIILDLSGEPPAQSLEKKGRQVERILTASAKAGNLHVMVIEEAHDLTHPTLRYLKRFWELEDGFKKLIGIVLVAQPELLLKLDESKNPGLREFIRRCEIATLKSLNGNLEEYLAHKFKRIGVALFDLFEADAFDAIRARLTRRRLNGEVESHLYPQVVQNLVAKAMNEAADLALPKISAQLIGRL